MGSEMCIRDSFRVASDFAPNERFQPCRDVPAKVFGSHGIATDHTDVTNNFPATDCLCCAKQKHDLMKMGLGGGPQNWFFWAE